MDIQDDVLPRQISELNFTALQIPTLQIVENSFDTFL